MRLKVQFIFVKTQQRHTYKEKKQNKKMKKKIGLNSSWQYHFFLAHILYSYPSDLKRTLKGLKLTITLKTKTNYNINSHIDNVCFNKKYTFYIILGYFIIIQNQLSKALGKSQ